MLLSYFVLIVSYSLLIIFYYCWLVSYSDCFLIIGY